MIRVCTIILAMLMAMSGAAESMGMKAILTVPHEFDMLVKSGHIQGLACSEKMFLDISAESPAREGGSTARSSSASRRT